MSKGPGRIQRQIAEEFARHPGHAPTTEELCEVVFPGVNRVEKKHRVSVVRAAKQVCAAVDGWQWSSMEALGGGLVFWNRYSVLSYATMRAKTDMFVAYRSNDTRLASHRVGTPETILASVSVGGRYHQHVMEGGAWWRHVQLWIAERDGDVSDVVAKLRDEQEAVNAQFQRMGDSMRASPG